MRSCHELVELLLRSKSSAGKQEAAAALALLPMTPRAWNTAVRAIPALVELIQQSSSAATREQAANALDHMNDFEHENNDLVEEVAADVIVSIVQLLKRDAEWVQFNIACTLREIS